ncbi:protein phosphatase 2C domain-containing protein [Candidatus Kaiserbacteria bacterium]|nr:protein phosphatase 2C domain-containing protein [Candidatus Kaiserbacteria bacterium]
MKQFNITEGMSPQIVNLIARRMGIEDHNHVHPREDFHAVSDTCHIYVVADGVTLIQYILDRKPYPHPSPAGDVARIFCEMALAAAEERYASFEPNDINEVFRIGNDAVGAYNTAHGRTKTTVDYWDMDLYAATAALAVIKDGMLYWGSICDSYVAQLDNAGSIQFQSPACSALKQAGAPAFVGDRKNDKEWKRYGWRTKRNGLNEKGERVGYGVITGEPEALQYLCSGERPIATDDTVIVFTDGFEHYMQSAEFTSLFGAWPDDLENQVKLFSANRVDAEPEKFGLERSLIAARV